MLVTSPHVLHETKRTYNSEELREVLSTVLCFNLPVFLNPQHRGEVRSCCHAHDTQQPHCRY